MKMNEGKIIYCRKKFEMEVTPVMDDDDTTMVGAVEEEEKARRSSQS